MSKRTRVVASIAAASLAVLGLGAAYAGSDDSYTDEPEIFEFEVAENATRFAFLDAIGKTPRSAAPSSLSSTPATSVAGGVVR